MLTSYWPLFDLVLRTPTLTLRYLDDVRAAQLARLAATAGVHGSDERPFDSAWALAPSPELERESLRELWRRRGETSPHRWVLPFAVYARERAGERLVGSQEVRGRSFTVTRTVHTGSWVARPEQGRGIGRAMRAAVLQLAFDGLGAQVAESGSYADNAASIAVTRSLGYLDNGWKIDERGGEPIRDLRFILERHVWDRVDHEPVEIEGLAPCLDLLGLPPPR